MKHWPVVKSKRNFLFIFLFTGLLSVMGCTSSAPLGVFHFSDAQKANRFYKESFIAWAKADSARLIDAQAVLCIGSSSMRMWKTIGKDLAPLKIIHRGFGGSTMQDVLLFKDFFARYGTNRILIYEGDNDMAVDSVRPEDFIENCKIFVNYIKEKNPQTDFYFISVKPSILRKRIWPKMQEANRLLKAYTARDSHLHYIDVAGSMLHADGTIRADIFRSDSLHMNAKGYRLWKDRVRKSIK